MDAPGRISQIAQTLDERGEHPEIAEALRLIATELRSL